MKIGFIGLGKMGGNMALRLVEGAPHAQIQGGHEIVGYARDPNPELAGIDGIQTVDSLAAVVKALPRPRAIWVMVPAGDATEGVINELCTTLDKGDLLIDGGNSFYGDSMRRGSALKKHGIEFLDVGTSGGIWGRKEGYCMMVGGEKESVDRVSAIFDTLAPRHGWAHVGRCGAGHFVKMIHNGIEYGLMEAYGEGFEILRKSDFDLDLHQVASVWEHGSVIRSWLLSLAVRMFNQDATLQSIQPYVEDSGEGRWTVQAAIEEAVPAPVISASLFARFGSRDKENFSARFCAALRKQFGGHNVITSDTTVKAGTQQLQE